MNSATGATQANEEQNPCLSSAEHDSNQVTDDSSSISHTDLELNTSLRGYTLGNKVPGQELDFTEPIPRSLTTSRSSILADSISILSTVPFLVLACLLARTEGDAVDQSSQRNIENSIKVVSGSFYLTSFTRTYAKILINPFLSFTGCYGSSHHIRFHLWSSNYPDRSLAIGERRQSFLY